LRDPKWTLMYLYNILRRKLFVRRVVKNGQVFYKYKGELYPEHLFKKHASAYIEKKALEFCKGRGLDIGAGYWPIAGAIPIEDNPDLNAYKLDKFQDGSLDFVFSSHCVEHLVDWQTAIKLWIKKLKPGGILFTYVPHISMVMWRPGEVNGIQHPWSPTYEVLNKFMEDNGMEVIDFEAGHDEYWSFYTVGRKKLNNG